MPVEKKWEAKLRQFHLRMQHSEGVETPTDPPLTELLELYPGMTDTWERELRELQKMSGTSPIAPEDILTAEEVCAHFKVSTVTLWRWDKLGWLPRMAKLRHVRYSGAAVLKFQREHRPE